MSLPCKVVLNGESDVGKSSTFIRFRDQKFIEHLQSTIGLDSFTQEIEFNENESDSSSGGTELKKAKVLIILICNFLLLEFSKTLPFCSNSCVKSLLFV